MVKSITNIETLGDRIQIMIDIPKVGIMDTSSMNVANETGKVIGIGKDCKLGLKFGDKIVFKAWAVDITNVNGEKQYFISESTKGICGVIK